MSYVWRHFRIVQACGLFRKSDMTVLILYNPFRSATSSPSSKRNLKPAPSPLETMPETPEPNPTPSTPVLSTSPQQPASLSSPTTPSSAPSNGRKRKAPGATTTMSAASSSADPPLPQPPPPPPPVEGGGEPTASPPPAKKSRTNTPWSPAEEQRLKAMRDAGNSWSEIAKGHPTTRPYQE
ncbi:MAG: hypothetical protein M1833_002189 [Piccolia ochrophora]|nr:MAG: hypothetical protein M1833_002189 [Piccolia ochrophora]